MADIKLSHNLEESKIINFSRDSMTKLYSLTNIKQLLCFLKVCVWMLSYHIQFL